MIKRDSGSRHGVAPTRLLSGAVSNILGGRQDSGSRHGVAHMRLLSGAVSNILGGRDYLANMSWCIILTSVIHYTLSFIYESFFGWHELQ